MLASQMAAVHMATMTFARRLNHVDNIPQQDSAERAFNKLARTFTTQVEALKRYRTGGEQRVTVQHVNVSEGGQAIVGNVSTPVRAARPRSEYSSNTGRGGGEFETKAKPMQSQDLTLSPSSPGRCGAKTRNSSPCRRVTGKNRCRMHGGAPGSGAPQGSRNSSYKHGGFTCEAIEERRALREMVAEFRDMAKALW
jgi:hypothetical protein